METLSVPPEAAVDRFAPENEFEKFIAFLPPLPKGEPVVHHRFVRLYIRTIEMKAGRVYSSKIHKTRHPFEISKGRVAVWTEQGGWCRIRAPYSGITEPGTKRFLVIEEDCVWTTFHETDKTDIAEIEKDIIEFHENPLLTAEERLRLSEAHK